MKQLMIHASLAFGKFPRPLLQAFFCCTPPVSSMTLLVEQCSVVQNRQILRHFEFIFLHICSNVVQV